MSAELLISVTKPRGKVAATLAGMGIDLIPIEEDEGNVDRYIVSKRVAVERRTAGSFARGIMEKTLFTSAIYLREHFAVPILIVEGQLGSSYSAMDPQALRGALSSMMLLYGVSVLSTPSPDETAALIAMIARQEQVGIPEISLIPKRKAVSLDDQQRRIVEMLPGSGMVMARQLLRHFGSVRRIANATEEELLELRGIGARTAKQIINVLEAEYESVDTERDLEDAIEAAPELLFPQPVTLLARQHVIFSEGKDKHVVDMVYHDPAVDELILVELKRGRITGEHRAQLRRYLDHAERSKLLRPHLEAGAGIRGVLATVEPCELKMSKEGMSLQVVDRKHVIEVLKLLRAAYWEGKA